MVRRNISHTRHPFARRLYMSQSTELSLAPPDLRRGGVLSVLRHKLSLFTLQEAEIKKMAKAGNKDACKILAKQLVQLRKQKTRTYAVSSKVGAMSTQAKLMNSQMKMAGAMASSAKVRRPKRLGDHKHKGLRFYWS